MRQWTLNELYMAVAVATEQRITVIDGWTVETLSGASQLLYLAWKFSGSPDVVLQLEDNADGAIYHGETCLWSGSIDMMGIWTPELPEPDMPLAPA